jgi:protein-S-isoprenylcysteine O-methyltransferase Ste14
MSALTPRAAAIGSAIFFLVGPGLEAGVGPWLLTGGFDRGDDLPAQGAATVLGAVLVVVGLAVVLDAFRRFVADGIGTPTPAAPTSRLVVRGAYRHVRNPMYVATAAIIAGEGLLLARPILFVAAAVYLTTLAVVARRIEEPGLRARFGSEWDAYRAAVPGWIPRVRPYRPST